MRSILVAAVVALALLLPATASASYEPTPVFRGVATGGPDASETHVWFYCQHGTLVTWVYFYVYAGVFAYIHGHYAETEATCTTGPGPAPGTTTMRIATDEGDLEVTWTSTGAALAPATGGGQFKSWTFTVAAADSR